MDLMSKMKDSAEIENYDEFHYETQSRNGDIQYAELHGRVANGHVDNEDYFEIYCSYQSVSLTGHRNRYSVTIIISTYPDEHDGEYFEEEIVQQVIDFERVKEDVYGELKDILKSYMERNWSWTKNIITEK